MKKAIILFSGGLDSATCLAFAKQKGFECHALSFNYGQKHQVEINKAKMIAKLYGASHYILDLPLLNFTTSLIQESTEVPDYTGLPEIPSTYVPARNTIFLAFSLGVAESLGAHDIFIGVSAIDYSGYPDCRPEYIKAFQKMANLGTKTSVEGNRIHIHTPLIYLSKAQTIQLGMKLGVDYSLTISCYRPDAQGKACGHCHSCFLRKKGFDELGMKDPAS